MATFVSCSADNKSETIAKADSKKVADNQVRAETDSPEIASNFVAYDTDGNLRDLNEWIGKKPVLINFWGTWCGPCRREIPELVKIYEEYGPKGVEIISLAVKDQPATVVSFTGQKNMNWVHLMATQDHLKEYGVSGVPTTFFYDKDGNLAKVRDHNGQFTDRFVGPRSYEIFKAAVESLL